MTPCVYAQAVATIYGTVTDPGGAVIPGVAVTITQTATGAARELTTDDSGNYVGVQLPVGSFTVRARATGFKEASQTGIVLQVNDNRRVDIQLQVGEVTERIEVQAASAQVETRTGTISEVIDQQRISELPLNGRNPVQLQALVAGVGRRGGRDQQQNETIAVNGSAFRGNNYALDGGDNHDPFFNTPAPFPNPDALQEFSIETNSYGADKGRNAGVFVSAVTRSGTNKFHGAAFEFLRNERLNARDWFANSVPPFKRHQFGGTVGGPVRRDRTFFFVSYQRTIERSAPGVVTGNPLSVAQRQGDFSSLRLQVRDPDGGTFPGNRIPASRLYQPSLRFLEAFVPLPNRPDGLLSFASEQSIDDDQRIVKIDHQLTRGHRLSSRLLYNYNDTKQVVGTVPGMLAVIPYTNWNGTISDTWVATPRTVHNFSFTAQNIKRNQSSIIPGNKRWEDFGAGLVRAHRENTPAAHSTNVIGYFNAFSRYPLFQERFYLHMADSAILTRGAHLIKFGGEIRYEKVDRVERFQGDAALTFRGQITGDAAADFVLGRVAQINQNSGAESYPVGHEFALFVQDDWKISRRLTLNLGLRWDPFTPPPDKRGTGGIFRPGERSTFFPNAPAGLVYWGQDPGVPLKYGFGNVWNNLGPRFGFALDPFGDGRNSIRGGYGIFYAARALQQLGGGGPGYALSLLIDPVPGGLANPYSSIGGNPFPFDPPGTPEERARFQFVRPVSVGGWDPAFRNGIVQQWNFSLQREVRRGYVVTAAYVASKGNHLESTREVNPGVFGRPGTLQQRRLYPDFSSVVPTTARANMTYHSMQLTLNKRLTRGFTLLASYTWAKNIDDASPIDGVDFSREKAVSANNIAHRVIGSFLWELPRLRGQPVLARHLVGGWELNGIVELESGLRFNVVSGRDNSGTGINNDRPDLAGVPYLDTGRPRSELIQQWFNTAAFRQNPAGTFGTAGRNLIDGPGSAIIDFGLVKNIWISEQHRLQIRGEAFNLFNQVNLDNPNGNLNSPTVGRITSAGQPRVMQLGLKYRF
jgi:hypothetical protein